MNKEIEQAIEWVKEFEEQIRMGLPDDVYFELVEKNSTIKQVYVKRYITPNEITEKTRHQPTIDFVKENYMDEKILILFLLW